MNLPKGVAVLLHQNGKFAFSLRVATAKTFPSHWQTPGGSVEPKETPLDAAVRELYEETGLDLSAERFIALGEDAHPLGNGNYYLGWGFAVNLNEHEKLEHKEPQKQSDWVWLTREEALGRKLIAGTAQYLSQFAPSTRADEVKQLSNAELRDIILNQWFAEQELKSAALDEYLQRNT